MRYHFARSSRATVPVATTALVTEVERTSAIVPVAAGENVRRNVAMAVEATEPVTAMLMVRPRAVTVETEAVPVALTFNVRGCKAAAVKAAVPVALTTRVRYLAVSVVTATIPVAVTVKVRKRDAIVVKATVPVALTDRVRRNVADVVIATEAVAERFSSCWYCCIAAGARAIGKNDERNCGKDIGLT